MSMSTSDKANPGMRFRFAACHSVLLSLFILLFGAGATAFADSRVGFNDPLSNFLISGEYYMWGWALFDTQPVSTVQITVGNNVPAYAHYGDPRPDVCNNGIRLNGVRREFEEIVGADGCLDRHVLTLLGS